MISVIITAFNVSNTILNTINSVLNQTYKDFELIIVEDCSTDNTIEIIKSIKDVRIKIIQHSVNMGAGLSRRDGVKNSTGDYTIFIDGDDTINKDCLERLYLEAIGSKSDIVSCGVLTTGPKGSKIYKTDAGIYKGVDKFKTNEDFSILFLNNKLVSKKLWDKVEYSELRYVEDTPTAYRLFYYANQISYIDYIGYNYILRDDSLCSTSTNIKKTIYIALAQIENAEFFKDKEDEYKQFGNYDLVLSVYESLILNKTKLCDIYPYINEYNRIVEYLKK